MAYSAIPFHGKVCEVEWEGTVIAYQKGWTISVNLDMADASRAGQNWKEALPGQAGWSGSFEMYYVPGNAQQILVYDNLIIAAPGTKLLTSHFNQDSATPHFSGDFYVISITINATMGDVVNASVNFQGNGALTNNAA